MTTLVAVAHGFYDNRLLNPGDSFEFDGTKVPKWAAAPADAAKQLAKKGPITSADLKPVAAQAAVRRKASAITE